VRGSQTLIEDVMGSTRSDPYRNYKFRIKWDGKYIAGMTKVSALKLIIPVVKHHDRGDLHSNRKSPGRTEFEPIILERGLTQDSEFEEWANKVLKHEDRVESGTSSGDFRKDIIIELYDEKDKLALSYKVYRCWVSEYQALPDLDTNTDLIAIQRIKIENEGWDALSPTVPS
jgi:phage tail-like protein